MRKLTLAMLVAALVLGNLCASAWAEEQAEAVIVPFYTYTDSITAGLSIDSDGDASCRGMVTPKDSSYSCSITVQLKRKSGSTWTTIATWSGSGQGYAGASASGTKRVTSGYSYMVSVSAVIKNSSGSVIERPSKDTAVKAY